MGNAGTRYGDFQTALRTGSYQLARMAAADLPRVDLLDALRLTLLAAAHDPARFEAFARRWLVRFLEEKRPSLQLAKWVTEDLEHVGAPGCPAFVREDAEARLGELARRL